MQKDKSIIGRDTDAAQDRANEGADFAEQLNATTSPDAGGTIASANADDDQDEELEILFEPEAPRNRLH